MPFKYTTVKPVFKCNPIISKETFKNAQCLLTISVGQEVHESGKFEATIKLVNDNFASCIVLIDDTLQRYTMALLNGQDPSHFYEKSLQEGDLWLERNRPYLNKLSIPYKIIRWDKWLVHPGFKKQLKRIHALVERDVLYRYAFKQSVYEFLKRYYKRFPKNKLDNLRRDIILCFNYLVEECAALCLWVELDCQFEVYPGKRNSAMAATHKHFVLPRYPKLLHDLSIKFKNRKQFKAQKFELLKEMAE